MAAMNIKGRLRETLLHFGYDLHRADPRQLGRDPFKDMRRLSEVECGATLFDVGANLGVTIGSFREHFRSPVIHAFEPGSSTFESLKLNTAGIPDLRLNNVALGSRCEQRLFYESSHSTASSFLPPGRDYLGAHVSGQTVVEVESIDNYGERNGISHIDVLKCDTQGFDYEVLKGGIGMLQEHKIHLVYIEVDFGELYLDRPHFDEIYRFFRELGFHLVSFYDIHFRNSRLGWLDGLFIDPAWRPSEPLRSTSALPN
jgi:FkbM family methyltransferase